MAVTLQRTDAKTLRASTAAARDDAPPTMTESRDISASTASLANLTVERRVQFLCCLISRAAAVTELHDSAVTSLSSSYS